MADQQHGSYYVPEYSIWPIIGAIGLFFFAIGSLNFSSIWGTFAFFIGLLTLIVMLFGWFGDVTRESHSGFYDAQMGRTFRWGMFWFLFAETFLFGAPIAALLYTRIFTLSWLGGDGSGGSSLTHYLLWPNFQPNWPLLENPNPLAFPGSKIIPSIWGLPVLSTLVIILSAVCATFSFWALKAEQRVLLGFGLVFAIILGVLFAVLQYHFMLFLISSGITLNSGIYGSLLFMLYGLHGVHLLVGLLMLMITAWLTFRNYFGPHRVFGFAATILFWDFITIVWLVIFGTIFVG